MKRTALVFFSSVALFTTPLFALTNADTTALKQLTKEYASWDYSGRPVKFRERLATRFAHLDKHFANNDYLMGKSFSVADPYLYTVSNWAPRVDVDLSTFGNVLAYRKRVGERPAVQAAMKAEGLLK